MFVFRHRPSGLRIGVNKKVLFSFATLHPDLEPVAEERCDYLLWRDPLDRTVSMFFDKCRAAVGVGSIQDVQKVLLAAMGEEDVEALSNLQFYDLVRLLPEVIERDDHLHPQLHGLKPGQIGTVIDIAWGLPALGRRIGLDFRRRENSSVHRSSLSYYTPETRAIVERLYASDYAVRPAPPAYQFLARLMGFR